MSPPPPGTKNLEEKDKNGESNNSSNVREAHVGVVTTGRNANTAAEYGTDTTEQLTDTSCSDEGGGGGVRRRAGAGAGAVVCESESVSVSESARDPQLGAADLPLEAAEATTTTTSTFTSPVLLTNANSSHRQRQRESAQEEEEEKTEIAGDDLLAQAKAAAAATNYSNPWRNRYFQEERGLSKENHPHAAAQAGEPASPNRRDASSASYQKWTNIPNVGEGARAVIAERRQERRSLRQTKRDLAEAGTRAAEEQAQVGEIDDFNPQQLDGDHTTTDSSSAVEGVHEDIPNNVTHHPPDPQESSSRLSTSSSSRLTMRRPRITTTPLVWPGAYHVTSPPPRAPPLHRSRQQQHDSSSASIATSTESNRRRNIGDFMRVRVGDMRIGEIRLVGQEERRQQILQQQQQQLQQQQQQYAVRPEDRNLVQAHLVEDADGEEDLSVLPILVEAKVEKNNRRVWIYSALAIAAMVLILGVSLGVTLNKSNNNNSNDNVTVDPNAVVNMTSDNTSTTLPPQVPPVYITTDLVQNFSSLLPYETVYAMRTNPSSPQARAYGWVTWDGQPPLLNARNPIQRMMQRFALATLYYATGGNTTWIAGTSGWLNYSQSECTWFGCVCGSDDSSGDGASSNQLEQQTIVNVVLSECRLTGTIPPEIALLEHLEDLRLKKNSLRGTIPTHIGLLTKLKFLTLSTNGFTGTLPNVEIGRLTNLEYFYLGENYYVSGTMGTEFGLLTNLREVDLGATPITGTIPTELGLLNNSLSWLSWPRSAETQNVSNIVSIPTTLWQLTNLNLLDMGGHAFTGTLPFDIGRVMTKLESLYLERNNLHGTLPSSLGMLNALSTLTVHSNQFSGSVPAELCTLISYGLVLRIDCLEVNCSTCGCQCMDNQTSTSTTSNNSTNV